MSKREQFKSKYKQDAFDFVNKVFAPYIGGAAPKIYPDVILGDYISSNGLNYDQEDIIKEIVEVYQEVGEKFPFKGVFEVHFATLSPTPVNPSIPKSKGTLEDFKDFISQEAFRNNLKGVYVDNDNALVATDAMKLVCYKTDEYHQYAGQIINLEAYLKSKGQDLTFINEKFPDYKNVVPTEFKGSYIVQNTYDYYNLAKSYIDFKKYIQSKTSSYPIFFEFGEDKKAFDAILLLDVFAFALKKGWTEFTLKYNENPFSALALDFGMGNYMVIMPLGTFTPVEGDIIYTPIGIKGEFGGGKPSIKQRAKTTPKPVSTPAPTKSKEMQMLEEMILLNLSNI